MTVETAALGELVEVLSGFAFKSKQFGDSGELPVVRIRDVVRGRSDTFYAGDYDEKYVVHDGDLLIGMDGEFNRARWKGSRALLNQRVCRISVADSRLDEGYLYHFLPAALKAIERDTPFVTVKHLSAKQIKAIAVPLPPIEEQRRIAAVLDAADELRAKRRQALAKLDTLAQAIFIDMFGDGSLPLVLLADLTKEFRYGTSSKSSPDGVPALRIPNVVGGSVSYDEVKRVPVSGAELERLSLEDGDLLFVRSNGNPDFVGRCAVFSQAQAASAGFNEPIIYASYLIRARLDRSRVRPTYASAFLSSHTGRRVLRTKCKTSAGQYNLNTKGLGSVQIPLPAIDDQITLDRRTRLVADRRKRAEAHLAQLDTLFASLRKQAFRGDL